MISLNTEMLYEHTDYFIAVICMFGVVVYWSSRCVVGVLS